MSETAPREPDVCPNCGAHVESLMTEHRGDEQFRDCPDCGLALRRRIGEPWERAGA
jgi:transposase